MFVRVHVGTCVVAVSSTSQTVPVKPVPTPTDSKPGFCTRFGAAAAQPGVAHRCRLVDAVAVGVTVGVTVTVAVGGGVLVAVAVGVGVGSAPGVRVGVGVGVGFPVVGGTVRLGVAEAEAEGLVDGDAVESEVRVGVGVGAVKAVGWAELAAGQASNRATPDISSPTRMRASFDVATLPDGM